MPRRSRPWKRATGVVCLVAAATFAAPPGLPAGAGGAEPLEPDLTTRRPDELELSRGTTNGDLIRFSNEILNRGNGPMEMQPEEGDCDGKPETNDRYALQRVFQDADADGVFDPEIDTGATEVEASCVVFHNEHDHWHFQDFALYELLPFKKNGSLGEPVAASEKVGFCLVDTNRVKPGLPGSPVWRRYIGGCTENDATGISVGWADLYSNRLYHQWIVIDEVPNGPYCLRSTADPENKIQETRERNNSRSIRIRLRSDSVEYEPRRPCL